MVEVDLLKVYHDKTDPTKVDGGDIKAKADDWLGGRILSPKFAEELIILWTKDKE